ncbi:cytochrome P450 family 72 protein [Medicago truncatula]|nr:cytochrome P450 family 72 protein [Medicago truncatula]
MIRDVFNKMYDFQKPNANPLGKLLANGLASHEGEQWSKHRKIINPAFHIMLPIYLKRCDDLISKWEKMLASDGSCEMEVWPFLQNLARDVISRAAFGSSYEEGKRIFQLQTEQAKLTMSIMTKVYIPGWRFLPTTTHRRMKEIERDVKASLTDIINKRERALKADWQERAREEVLQVFGNNKPEFDGLSHLKIVTMILYEVLRLYPPEIALTRSDHKDMTLGNLTLPAGVQVFLSIILVHHDIELWGEDAKVFNPERFSEAKMAIAMILQRFSFELSPSYAHAPATVITLQPQYGAHIILRKVEL